MLFEERGIDMRTAKCGITGRQIHMCSCQSCAVKMKEINKSIKEFKKEIMEGEIKSEKIPF